MKQLPDYNLEPPEDDIDCPACDGTGKDVDEGKYIKCFLCKGTGKVDPVVLEDSQADATI